MGALRFQTYFNVPVPPFKEEKIGAGGITVRFLITGSIASKKNNQQAVTLRKDAKIFLYEQQKKNNAITIDDAIQAINMVSSKIRGNDEYRDFVEQNRPVIEHQKKEWERRLQKRYENFSFPISKAAMSIRLYFKDRYVTDTVNKQQSIQDLLVECGVVANDDYKTLNPIHSASACYYEELIHNIAFISLSFKL
jgi:hypothetical protein